MNLNENNGNFLFSSCCWEKGYLCLASGTMINFLFRLRCLWWVCFFGSLRQFAFFHGSFDSFFLFSIFIIKLTIFNGFFGCFFLLKLINFWFIGISIQFMEFLLFIFIHQRKKYIKIYSFFRFDKFLFSQGHWNESQFQFFAWYILIKHFFWSYTQLRNPS